MWKCPALFLTLTWDSVAGTAWIRFGFWGKAICSYESKKKKRLYDEKHPEHFDAMFNCFNFSVSVHSLMCFWRWWWYSLCPTLRTSFIPRVTQTPPLMLSIPSFVPSEVALGKRWKHNINVKVLSVWNDGWLELSDLAIKHWFMTPHYFTAMCSISLI